MTHKASARSERIDALGSTERIILKERLRLRRENKLAPLSFGQRRLWFLSRLYPGNPMYNEPLLVVRIVGPCDTLRLQGALDRIIERHHVLRTTFPHTDGEPYQLVLPAAPMAISVCDLQSLASETSARLLESIYLHEADRAFDLENGPLLRAHVVRLAPDEHILVVSMHHIVSDGWSLRLFLRQLTRFYSSTPAGDRPPSRSSELQYVDYALWQQHLARSPDLERQRQFWQRRLQGRDHTVALPLDLPRPANPTRRGQVVVGKLSRALVDRILGECSHQSRANCTRFSVLLAAFACCLSRFANQEEISIATPVANRTKPEFEDLLGFFVNVLALTVNLSGNPRYWEVTARTASSAMESFENQDYPFDLVVQDRCPDRNLSEVPMLNVLFAYHNFEQEELHVDGLRMERIRYDRSGAKYDLALLAVDVEEEGIELQLCYDTALFSRATAERYLSAFEQLLQWLPGREKTRVWNLPLTSLIDQRTSTDGTHAAKAVRPLSF